MRTCCVAIALCLLCCAGTFSQSCLPDGIKITSQAAVDSFSILYPNCTEIEGNLILNSRDSTEISNLSALSKLTKINGSFQIGGNSILTDLKGLDNITEIGGNLYIFLNEKLINIKNLKNIKKVNSSLIISNNSALVNLEGLDNLVSIGSNLTLNGNDVLEDVINLKALTSINGDLTIWGNVVLTSLRGLDNIAPATINNLEIAGNYQLAGCSINSICGFLETDRYSYLTYNATGCNVVENILNICAVKPSVNSYYNNISISINFTQQYLNIKGLLKPEQYQIININGSLIKHSVVDANGSIALNNLDAGIYFFILKDDDIHLKTSSFAKF